jgi:hypothetical protein
LLPIHQGEKVVGAVEFDGAPCQHQLGPCPAGIMEGLRSTVLP